VNVLVVAVQIRSQSLDIRNRMMTDIAQQMQPFRRQSRAQLSDQKRQIGFIHGFAAFGAAPCVDKALPMSLASPMWMRYCRSCFTRSAFTSTESLDQGLGRREKIGFLAVLNMAMIALAAFIVVADQARAGATVKQS